MKKSSIKLQVAAAFTASMLVLSALFSCANDSENYKGIPKELTVNNAEEILGEDYKDRNTIKIPEGVVYIKDQVFFRCDAQSIIISSTVTKIEDGQFYGAFGKCENLQSIEIPESITYIGNNAFKGCESLKEVTFNEGLTTIGDAAFHKCSSLSEITMPQSVTSIGYGAFSDCSSLRKVVLAENISSIGDATFYGCTALTDITIPKGVTLIGENSFSECENLTEIILPKRLFWIGASAFNGCFSLKSVKILATIPPDYPKVIGMYPFDRNDSNRKFYVPEDSVETYQTRWSEYSASIEAIQ